MDENLKISTGTTFLYSQVVIPKAPSERHVCRKSMDENFKSSIGATCMSESESFSMQMWKTVRFQFL